MVTKKNMRGQTAYCTASLIWSGAVSWLYCLFWHGRQILWSELLFEKHLKRVGFVRKLVCKADDMEDRKNHGNGNEKTYKINTVRTIWMRIPGVYTYLKVRYIYISWEKHRKPEKLIEYLKMKTKRIKMEQ